MVRGQSDGKREETNKNQKSKSHTEIADPEESEEVLVLLVRLLPKSTAIPKDTNRRITAPNTETEWCSLDVELRIKIP